LSISASRGPRSGGRPICAKPDRRAGKFALRDTLRDAVHAMQDVGVNSAALRQRKQSENLRFPSFDSQGGDLIPAPRQRSDDNDIAQHDAAIGQLRLAAKFPRRRQIGVRRRALICSRRDHSLPCSFAAIVR
jgi:hypothetical protein